ncbi:MAG: KEOPS complex kinase/ATPase Bud32 [archaeon]
MKLIAKGAEAEIFLDKDKIIKRRIQKSYRVESLDLALRKTRSKREAKILEKLPDEVNAPILFNLDLNTMQITMEYLSGDKVRDILEDNLDICDEIGKKIAIMHNAGIIHGDLTTSNMVYDGKLHFIDFGLSFFSDKIEDKAVDLHLLRQAFGSKHYSIADKAFKIVLSAYKKNAKQSSEILKRFTAVESRGRNKAKI